MHMLIPALAALLLATGAQAQTQTSTGQTPMPITTPAPAAPAAVRPDPATLRDPAATTAATPRLKAEQALAVVERLQPLNALQALGRQGVQLPRTVAAIDSTTAMSIGSTCAASQNTAAPVAPTSQPTRGRKRAAWLSFSGAKATQPGTGRRVK